MSSSVSARAAPATDREGWNNAYAAALAASDILQDPLALEDRAIFQWLKARQLPHFVIARPHGKGHHYVLGSAPLPGNWLAQKVRFGSMEDARHFLRPLAHNLPAMQVVTETLFQVEGSRPVCETAEATLDRLARLLLTARVWIMPLEKPAQADIGRTGPAVYTALNRKYQTSLDIAQLSRWEGGQYLRGYVPFTTSRDSSGHVHDVVAGTSGMTIATGFDLGQHTAARLQAIKGLSSDGLKAILHFAGRQFPGLGRPAVIQAVTRIAPVPVISKADADLLDGAAAEDALTPTIAAWNAHRKAHVPTFQSLPAAWQTVLFSRTYNQGPAWMQGHSPTRGFFAAATQGKWADAVKALRDAPVRASWYRARLHQEATFLATQMPPAVEPPKPPKAAPATPAPTLP